MSSWRSADFFPILSEFVMTSQTNCGMSSRVPATEAEESERRETVIEIAAKAALGDIHSKSRLLAAMTRTSTLMVLGLRDVELPLLQHPQQLGLRHDGISPISSRTW